MGQAKTLAMVMFAAGGLALGCGIGNDVPKIVISHPLAGETVTLGSDMDKSATLTLKIDFMALKAPGQCDGAKNCGHLHINIDGDACNDTVGMSPYNNAAVTSTPLAKFAFCPDDQQVGMHTITVSAHDDTHAPLTDGGKPIEAEVAITTQLQM